MKRPLIIMYTLFTASLLATVLALLHCAELDFVYDNPCDKTGINYQGCHDWTITFDPNGGTLTTTSVTTGVGDTLGSLPTPARTGYTFKGWYTASTSGTKVTEDRKYNGNTTIYAQWTPIDYTITYDLDGGNVSSANRASYNIETTAITLRNPTKTGYTFAGWTGTNGMPATTVVIQSGSTGDRSYTAQWTLNKYRITFNANNGTVTPAFDSTGAGWTLSSLPTPIREGYAFNGWWTAATGGDSVTVSRVYSANTNIYAKWTLNTYMVTFNSQSGSSVSSQTIDHGGKVTEPTAPTRANYIFGGWYKEVACTNLWNFSADVVTSAITLYAKWNAVYTVTFNANGGTVTTTSSTTGEGWILASLPTPARDGYTFNGWFTASTGGTEVTESRVYSANTTIYARWTPITYTITYDLTGGSVSSSNPVSYTIEATTFTLGNPTKTGYTFAGWTGTNGTTPQTTVSISKGNTGNRSYTANWTINNYTVTFNSQSGSTVSSQSIEYNGKATTPAAPTRTGYTFDGWYKETAYTTAWNFGTDVVTTAITLYAKWTPVTYMITYDLDGGSVSSSNPANYTVETTTFMLNNPTKTGYTFAGWTGTNGTTPQTTVSISRGNIGDRNYTANWNLNTYIITFNSQSGSSVSSQTIYHGGKVTEPTPPTRANYIFGGWYKEAACTNVWNFSADVVTSAITLYAKWNAVYTVTFNANGGTVTTTSSTTGEGWILASLPTPTREGFTFNGWYTASFGGDSVTVSKVYSANATIYARWLHPSVSTFVDSRDSKKYNKVTIGEQVWMAENLNYDIPDNTSDVCYGNRPDSCAKYGRLYDWGTSMGLGSSYYGTVWGGSDVKRQGVCPVGWHLPSDDEWTQLTDYVGGTSKAGTKLKSSAGWNSYSGVPFGTDEYGFSALPGGYGNSDGNFYGAGNIGYWWSATEYNADNA